LSGVNDVGRDSESNRGSGPNGHLPLVEEAADRIRPHVLRTPLLHSPSLSDRFGFSVYLKLENLQKTGAFKIRGATNKVRALREEGCRHVVAASSGSHAIGVSLAARACGIRATIVMPTTSPEVKRRKVVSYGAELLVEGRDYDDAKEVATDLARCQGAVIISGIEDPLVMAGQGTMGLEILEDLPAVDFVAIPVGGGGAIGGLLMGLKEVRPEVRVWGVQSSGAPSMKVSLERGRPTELPSINTIADAVAVRRPGALPFQLVRDRAEGVVAVDDDLLLEAVGRLALEQKLVAEPAGVAALAVDWPGLLPARPRAAVFIITGGNIDPDLLAACVARPGG